MKTGNGFLIVQYDNGHMRDYDLGGVKIEISREVNMNQRDGMDQKATVVAVSDECKWLKPGDVIWTHYLASGSGSEFTHDGVKLNRIKESTVFFKIEKDGTIKMAKNVYLCKQVVSEGEKTASGIYVTPFSEKKEPLKLEVVSAPENYYDINPGDVVISKDDNQYLITYNKEEYVKIDFDFILAKYEQKPA